MKALALLAVCLLLTVGFYGVLAWLTPGHRD